MIETIKAHQIRVLFGGVQGSSGHHLYGGEESELPPPLRSWDGQLQPGIVRDRRGNTNYYSMGTAAQVQGATKLYWVGGWTAICFWDRSADSRGGCNANFFADAHLTFAEMCKLAAERYPAIWQRFNYEVHLVETEDHEPKPRGVLIECPFCRAAHVDGVDKDGIDWAARPHHVHLCLACAKTFRIEPFCYGLPHPVASEELTKALKTIDDVRALVDPRRNAL